MNKQISIDRLHIRLRNISRARAQEMAASLGKKLADDLGKQALLGQATGAIKIGTLDVGLVRIAHDASAETSVAEHISHRIGAALTREGR